MVYVTSDPHGHRDVLVDSLQRSGLLDVQENWGGGEAELWVLGDLMDRGPDGVGVVDLVMRMQVQAESAGGSVGVVLGNHEVLALGMHQYGLGNRSTDADSMSLVLTWQANGGRLEDQEALTDRHIEWMASLPALAVHDDLVLMHSDTMRYLEYGHDVETVNQAIAKALAGGDIDRWWECLRRMTDRYAFAQSGGPDAAAEFAGAFGARRLAHGHSIVADLRGIEPAETDGALLYCDRRVLAVDGGIYAGGPCLVVDLDTWPE
jgi:Calcineurin-like phosphoesterase